jgi:hypothetical protein
MKTTILFCSLITTLAFTSGMAQSSGTTKQESGLLKMISEDSLKKIHTAIIKNFSKDSIHKQANQIYYGKPTTVFHTGWEDGRVPEFSNAYTLHRHEFRLNVIGRSSYAITDKLEVSSYLPLLITPNISFKYRFLDHGNFASSFELGTAGGLFPIAVATGIVLPGGAVGAGTAGFIKGSDNHIKIYSSWHPTQKLTFSVRGSISFLKIGYTGLVGFAGVGGDGAAAGFFPIGINQRANYLMGGFETDYVLNKQNAIVFNTSISGFEGGKNQLIVPSICWTHAKTHFHYTLGLYTFLDPPTWQTWQAQKSKMPVGPYANVYWVFNNRVRK